MKFIYICCILGMVGISGAFAQSGDKLLNILSGELNKPGITRGETPPLLHELQDYRQVGHDDYRFFRHVEG